MAMHWRHYLAVSNGPLARLARAGVRITRDASIPAPRLVTVPVLHCVLALRTAYYFVVRVLVCEPLFKAYCTAYGRNVHTGTYLHWIKGRGDIVIGDNVRLDGKISIAFGARLATKPTLQVGSYTHISHAVSITVAKLVRIGEHCQIAGGVVIFDSPGHPTDPEPRRAGMPPRPQDVKPVTVEDGVWIGRNAIIFPGVTVGEGSVVAAGSIVMSDVSPFSIVAGNPARKIGTLAKPAELSLSVEQAPA